MCAWEPRLVLLLPRSKVAVVTEDLPDVGAGLRNPWDLVVLHLLHAGVIGGKRESDVPMIPVQEIPELPGARADVLKWIKRVGYLEGRRRGGHELHEPNRPFV